MCFFTRHKGSHTPKETEEHQFGFHVRDRSIFTLLNLSLQKLIFRLLQLSVILRSALKQHVTFSYDSQNSKTLSKMIYSHYNIWCVDKSLGIRIKKAISCWSSLLQRLYRVECTRYNFSFFLCQVITQLIPIEILETNRNNTSLIVFH